MKAKGNECKAHSHSSATLISLILTATDNIFSKHALQWLTTMVHSIDQVLPT